MNSSPTPASLLRHERVEVADVLRGLAVMGILLLHCIEHFNFSSYPDTSTQGAWLDFTDRAVWNGLFFLLGGKAYAIFALLFGFSFFIQDDNERMRGRDFRGRFCWRLVLLFVIGNFNAAFFTAEILVLYSLVGFVLVAAGRLSDRALAWIALLCLLQPVALYHAAHAAADASYVTPSVPTREWWGATYAVQSTGTFWQTVKVNLREGQLASLGWAWDHGRIFQTAALFLLGLLAGRRGWLLERNLAMWGRVLAGALVAFFPLYGLDNMLPQFVDNANLLRPLRIVTSSLANFSFMLVLVAGVLFGFYRSRGLGRAMRQLIPYGRMSLTNYVTQSIVGSLIFYNWGLGMHDRLGITASAALGAGLFVVQYLFCRRWMRTHRHGPMEWLWKRATWIGR